MGHDVKMLFREANATRVYNIYKALKSRFTKSKVAAECKWVQKNPIRY